VLTFIVVLLEVSKDLRLPHLLVTWAVLVLEESLGSFQEMKKDVKNFEKLRQ
jgi:hypothetical protein